MGICAIGCIITLDVFKGLSDPYMILPYRYIYMYFIKYASFIYKTFSLVLGKEICQNLSSGCVFKAPCMWKSIKKWYNSWVVLINANRGSRLFLLSKRGKNSLIYPLSVTWCMNKTKVHINTLTQASKNGRKPYLFLQKKFISVFYAINIFNTIYYFKPTNFICA